MRFRVRVRTLNPHNQGEDRGDGGEKSDSEDGELDEQGGLG